MDRATLLLIEDDFATRTFLADNLGVDGYDVIGVGSVGEARGQLDGGYPDLAILDLGLPDADGLELLRYVRLSDRIGGRVDPDLPILVVSGRGSDLDRLRGFDRGADDYVVKPYAYIELRARIGALLRRSQRRPGLGRLRVGPLVVDQISRQVWLHGEPMQVSKKEFALLRALCTEPTRVFTREELLRGVWGYQHLGSTRTLDSHAARLRRKLCSRGDSLLINVWGVGYRLIDGEPA